MPVLSAPAPLPAKPVILKAALLVAWLWLALSPLLPVLLPEPDSAGLLLLAQFFAFNALLLFHAGRGDTSAHRAWAFLQPIYAVIGLFDVGQALAGHDIGYFLANLLVATLSLLAWMGLRDPLSVQWFAQVQTARNSAPAPQRLLEARFQLKLALVWCALAPAALTLGGGFEGPGLPQVLAAALIFAIVGVVVVVVQARRVVKLARKLS